MPTQVFLLTIEHKHGVIHDACASFKRAAQELSKYVRAWWPPD